MQKLIKSLVLVITLCTVSNLIWCMKQEERDLIQAMVRGKSDEIKKAMSTFPRNTDKDPQDVAKQIQDIAEDPADFFDKALQGSGHNQKELQEFILIAQSEKNTAVADVIKKYIE